MGGRGQFLANNRQIVDFKWKSIGVIGKGKIKAKILVDEHGNPHTLPVMAHSPNSIYVTVRDGKIAQIRVYRANHYPKIDIDFSHSHGDVGKPHVQYWRRGDRVVEGYGKNGKPKYKATALSKEHIKLLENLGVGLDGSIL